MKYNIRVSGWINDGMNEGHHGLISDETVSGFAAVQEFIAAIYNLTVGDQITLEIEVVE